MIVHPTKEGWQIIYHRAHALLATELAAQWRPEFRPERWVETLVAIMQHDDLEREWEANDQEDDHLTDVGVPRDFTLPGGPTSLEGLHEITINAQYRGRWVALLSSMHQTFLNEPRRGEQAKLDQFLDEQLEQQKQWRRALKVKKEEAEKAYTIMQWSDRLSLILCQKELPSRERALEISKGPDGVRYDVMQRDDGSINVMPWPFEQARFTVSVEATCLEQARFKNNTEFRERLKASPIEVLTWEFSEKQPPKTSADFTPAN